jgi:hydroxymethylbilane synthase
MKSETHDAAMNTGLETLVIGTRGSALALAQAEMAEAALRNASAEPLALRREVFVTRGDQKLDLNLLTRGDGGGKGLFTRELEEALLDRRIDVAVHSLKDLPGHQPHGLRIAAVLPRAAVGDLLVTKGAAELAEVPMGATVGTSSVRRARQLQWLRPDLKVVEWRGNVPTRLRKFAQGTEADAIVLAQAGMERLGLIADHDGWLQFENHSLRLVSLLGTMLPAIGQGVVALQCRENDTRVERHLANVHHPETGVAVRFERELQRLLSGDCSIPVGVLTTLTSETICGSAILFPSGTGEPRQCTVTGSVEAPESAARSLFADLTADKHFT